MKSLLTIWIFFFSITLHSLSVLAQTNATLTGSVTDKTTKEALIGANVYLKGTSIGAVTDAKGNYLITKIPNGEYTLVTSYIGYESYQEQINITAGIQVEKNIQLSFSGGKNLEEVKVTAQAKGQYKAINQQLAAGNIKNVVSSDRIRELPDANAAESLSRLPGISLQRTGGEGNKVIVRGLSPKYTKVMVDGVELASTDANDRSVSLSGISAYSLEGIEVVKSPTADMEGDFIGGAVNFRLRSAPKGFHAEAMAQGSYNYLKNTFNDYIFMGSLSNRFFNNKLGIFLMGQAENRNRSAHIREIGVYPYNSGIDTSDITIYQESLSDQLRRTNRYNATLVIDYPLRNGSIKLKNFYSQRLEETKTYSQAFPTKARYISLNTNYMINNQKVLNNVLSFEKEFGAVKIDGQVSHSFSGSNNPESMNFGFSHDNAMDQVPDNVDPDSIMNYSNFDVNRTRTIGFSHSPATTKHRQYQADMNLEWNLFQNQSVSGKLKIGGRYRHLKREFSYDLWNANLVTAGQKLGRDYIADNRELFEDGEIEDEAYINYTYFIDPNYDSDRFFGGKFEDWAPGTDIEKLKHLEHYLMEDYFKIRDTVPHNLPYLRHDMYQSLTHNYYGTENYLGFYIMTPFNFGEIVEFNPGLRLEQNRTIYTAHQGNSLQSGPDYNRYVGDTLVTTTRENQFLLPMIHLKIKPLKWLQFHLAYTHTLSRPNFNWIIPRQDYGDQNTSDPKLVINNINLEPELSKNIDLVASIHNNYVGLLNINLFSKRVENKIFRDYTKKVGERYLEFDVPEIFSGYSYNWHYNDTFGVKIDGIELDWQTSFWYLPGALKGLVFSANYTFLKSRATYPAGHAESFDHDNNPWTPDTTVFYDHPYQSRLIDQPSHILNLSLGYDYKGFSIRTSMRYQDNVFRGTAYVIKMRTITGSYLRFDISATQKLPYGLVLFTNFNNINNAEDTVFSLGKDYPTHTEQYGMTIDIGLRWNLNKKQ